LPAGAEDLKVDFGFNRSGASVGDTVWLDSNSDGIQQPNEIGLSGIEVILQSAGADGKLNTADDIFTKTTTDSKGYYQFGNLNAGQISVGVNPDTLPAGAQFTTPSAKSLNLQENEHRTDVDFGVNANGQIGDLVWIDSNGDGIQNNGEIGVSGVVVQLRSAGNDGILGNADDVIRTQTTDLSGKYLFNGLPPASYQVSIQTPTGLSNTTPSLLNVNLAAGQVDLKEDFGLKGNSWIGDTVWLDQNGDKIQQVGEAGLAGVRLNLYGAGVDGIIGTPDDSLLRSTTTDASGNYLFDGLSGGQYQVKVDSATLPAGLTITLDNNATKIVLPTGDHREDIDFGYQGLGKIGDTVFLDANGDGTQNNGEIGVANQGVKLTFAGKDGLFNTADDVIENTTTDSAGKYLFNGLPSGHYKVELSNVSNGLSATTPSTLNVSLGIGETNLKQDFGLKVSGSIGDFVWYDQNNDGIQGVGESGLAGVVVQLRSAGNDGVLGNADDVIQTQTTDSAGKYLFTNLAAGQYQVSVINGIPVTLSPSVQSAQNIGSNVSPIINLTSGAHDLKQDFGYQGVIYGTGKIGDTVFLDSNGDGVQNNGEKGIANQVVTLIHPGGDGVFGTGDDISATTTTDANGQYLFSGLPASQYQVKVNPINGLLNTTPAIFNVTLANGEINLKEDFGFKGTGSIGDYIWHDVNNDGIQGVGESGLAGVTVQLRYAGQDGLLNTTDDLVMLQTTDSAGKYLFTNLAAGQYQVSVINGIPVTLSPSVQSAQNIGSNVSPIINLANGQTDLKIDFGYFGLDGSAAIGNLVWADLNGDGLVNAGEVGLANVPVTLTWAGADGQFGTADDVIIRTQTDPNGVYQIKGLQAGNYRVTTGGIDGYHPTTPTTLEHSLQNGEFYQNALFGFQPNSQPNEPEKIPDYKVTIDDGVSSVKIGQTITYTITVQNIGQANGQQVVIKDILPADVLINISASDGGKIANGEIIWILDQLGIGETKVFTVTATINPTLDISKVHSFDSVVTVIDDNNPANDPTPSNNISNDVNNLIGNVEKPTQPEKPTKPINPYIPDEGFTYFYYEEHLVHQGIKEKRLFDPNDIQFKLPPLPVAPIYSGMVAPGTSVTLKLYDDNGVELGSNTVMADTGGNWLMNFPNLVLWDAPHSIRVEQLPALYNNNVMSVFDMRTFFTPAINSQLFFSHELSISTMMAFAPNEILEALHRAYNYPIAITWDNFKSYEFVAKSSTTTQASA
ncbi:MAG: hypothetical protein RIT27_38, partial [Pseudomonadota bacterium]